MEKGKGAMKAAAGNREAELRDRIELAAAFRWAARLNMHEGICNHFTVLLSRSPCRVLINPKGVHFAKMTAGSLIVIDETGKTVEGEGRPPMSGVNIHVPMHLAHSEARVVLHCHMPYATALTAIKGGRLEMVHQNSARFFGRVAYDDHFNGIARETDEGRRMAAARGDKPILFLANHGVIAVSDSIATAFDDLYYLERACQVQLLAMQSGRPLNVMPEAVVRQTAAEFGNLAVNAELHFTALKAALDEEEPAYAS
ncbi:MAG TPA: aldolase [Alphaproteobacteria bacterium]|nr:aldolase [Alphaproteobacteria bacterium]